MGKGAPGHSLYLNQELFIWTVFKINVRHPSWIFPGINKSPYTHAPPWWIGFCGGCYRSVGKFMLLQHIANPSHEVVRTRWLTAQSLRKKDNE